MKRLVRIVTASVIGFFILGALATGVSADSNKQAAANLASNNQTALAISGDAYATFGIAKSGDATAINASIQKQSIEQNAANVNFGSHGYDSNTQLALNAAKNDQDAAAASGSAAAWLGFASSGDATAVNLSAQKQEIEQNALNLSIGTKKHHHRR